MSILSNLRDRAIESFIRKNETVLRFGEIQEVSIDSDARIASVWINLRGETETTLFRGYYGFDEGEKGTELIFEKITCERTWINEALKMALSGKKSCSSPFGSLKRDSSALWAFFSDIFRKIC